MKLTQLLERLEYEIRQGSDEVEVTELINDSRKVTEGSVFVCISGAVSDGHKYIDDVASQGGRGSDRGTPGRSAKRAYGDSCG